MNDKNQPNAHPMIRWTEESGEQSACWRSESRKTPPKKVIVIDDTMTADTAYRHACGGTGMLWRGDFQNAKQLLNAMTRRVDRKPKKPRKEASSPVEAFHRYRMAVSNRTRILGMLLIEMDADHAIHLGRAPDARQAIAEALGTDSTPGIIPLRELLGIIGAHEWRKKGIDIPSTGGRIHPHYGVFSPIRTEYIGLVAEMPLPSHSLALDIGTGTGVLAAVLAQKGVSKIIATDNDPRAISCARENMMRLGLQERVEIMFTDMFPPHQAPLIVCNPPWIPARPVTPLEKGIYDPDSSMLYRFLNELPHYLTSGGEAWLLLSDLAEHLELRTRDALLDAFTSAGLTVLEKIDARPNHPRAADINDPLYAARSAETTSLWRLAPA